MIVQTARKASGSTMAAARLWAMVTRSPVGGGAAPHTDCRSVAPAAAWSAYHGAMCVVTVLSIAATSLFGSSTSSQGGERRNGAQRSGDDLGMVRAAEAAVRRQRIS